ncbi:MAG: hypothetical protein WA634_03960 [Silvibacterium sp.]
MANIGALPLYFSLIALTRTPLFSTYSVLKQVDLKASGLSIGGNGKGFISEKIEIGPA